MDQWQESEDGLNTSKLTAEELKYKIIELNNRQLSSIKDMSYYYLIGGIGKLVELVEDKNILEEMHLMEEKKTLVEIYHLIVNSFKKFHEDMVEKEIDQEISKLLDIRGKLHDLAMTLHAYEIEISYIKELIDHHMMKRMSKLEYKDLNIDVMEINFLVNKIRKTLDNVTEYNVFIAIVSNILSIIPFRMSKFKYFHVVKTNLIRNFNNYPLNVVRAQIEEYKILFDGSLMGDYGILFDNYFTHIQRFRNMNIASKTTDELEGISRDIIQITGEINKWGTFINNLGVVLNRLMVIYLTKHEVHSSLNMEDIFKRWEEYYQERESNLLDSLVKTCEKELEELERELIKGAMDLEKLNQEVVRRRGFDDESFNEKILFTSKILTYYNDLKFTRLDLLFPDKYEIVEKGYLIQLVDNLIQYMSRSISTMTNLEGKIRMRRFLSFLHLPFENMDEFFSYIEYSLDGRATSTEEVLFTMDTIHYLLDEYIERQ
ncbi:hypothetical protein [Schnuerera ultunensis]|uniref:hypothetical protein n=1 Tax=Schnuerera ultunensis TaxID=45497 RepID=UPI00041D1A63|nr:hypothetical protein [Schnuerera ultunensis]